jgi:hypothetical protein
LARSTSLSFSVPSNSLGAISGKRLSEGSRTGQSNIPIVVVLGLYQYFRYIE